MQINSQKIVCTLAEKQMNRADLANAAGMTRSQLSTILKRGTATEISIGKIAAGLGISPALIMVRDQEAPR
jgi:DNA-binding Xre family transcriptional regulator